MAIKDDINSIKEGLSTEEQFLENIIKSERFVKKYKKLFIFMIVIAFVIGSGYYINSYIKEQNFKAANIAYSKLIANPKDEVAISELKKKDISLYALFVFKQSLENNDTNLIHSVINEPIDPLLKEILKSQDGGSNEILSNYKIVLKAYELIKSNKIEEANVELKKIPANSPLQAVVKNLQHYQGNTKWKNFKHF